MNANDENRYYDLRRAGLNHDAATKQISDDKADAERIDRSEWSHIKIATAER